MRSCTDFGRELMQLFTIGPWLLDDGGTRLVDANGDPLQSYDNDDILSAARAWTGFVHPTQRGNLEPRNLNPLLKQHVDPMRILPERRDVFPSSAAAT